MGHFITSPFPIDDVTVLDPMDNHDSGVVVDFVDHSIVSAPSRVQASEFTDEFFA
jgi:hypothetical protein